MNMNKELPKYMQLDIQAEETGFANIGINKVGVRKIKCPVAVKRKDGSIHHSVAEMSCYISLEGDKKGINMSRNSRVLFEHLPSKIVDIHDMGDIALKLTEAHGSDNVSLTLRFEYMHKMPSPVTGIEGFEPCEVTVKTVVKNGVTKSYLRVVAIESSCCPCSKNMSLLKNNITDEELEQIETCLSPTLVDQVLAAGYGAHNQRSHIDMLVELNRDHADVMWIEDLITIAKSAASAPTHNILKREDEKYITEKQYFNAKFCEDIIRDTAVLLFEELDKRISDFVIVVSNKESIHTTLDAVAVLNAGRLLK